MRHVLLILALAAFALAGWGYRAAIRLTTEADAAARITTWGPDARAEAWRTETLRYRAIMRWSRRLGVVLFMIWAYLSAMQ